MSLSGAKTDQSSSICPSLIIVVVNVISVIVSPIEMGLTCRCLILKISLAKPRM